MLFAIPKLLTDSDLEPEYMQRLYDLAEAADHADCLDVRAHAAAVVSLYLADIARQRSSLHDDTEVAATATLALLQKHLSQILDCISRLQPRPELSLYSTLIDEATEIEGGCGEEVERFMCMDELPVEQHHAVFVDILAKCEALMPKARALLYKVSQVAAFVAQPAGPAH